MIEQTIPKDNQEPKKPLDPILKMAWQTLIRYDRAALQLKAAHIHMRAIVLILSFSASLLAVGVGFLVPSNLKTYDKVYPYILMLLPLIGLIPLGIMVIRRRSEWRMNQVDTPRLDSESENISENSEDKSVWERIQKKLLFIDETSWQLIFIQASLLIVLFVIFLRQVIVNGLMWVIQSVLSESIFPFFVISIALLPTYFLILRLRKAYKSRGGHSGNISAEQSQADLVKLEENESDITEDDLTEERVISNNKIKYESILILFLIALAFQVGVTILAMNEAIKLGFGSFVELLRLILFALPLISTGILAYATRFVPSQLWVQYRSITEAIRREIYLYRFYTEDYKNHDNPSKLLHDRLKEIQRKGVLYRNKSVDANKSVIGQQSDDIIPVNVFERDEPFIISDDELLAQIRDTIGDPKRKITTVVDNGFRQLSFKAYLEHRVYPMYDWYTTKSHNEYKKMRNWQLIGLIIGGAGSFLAFLGHEAWIAVTTSGAVTVSALANLQLSGRTYLLYYRAASDLQNRSAEWDYTRDEKERPTSEERAMLVEDFENIFEHEGQLWRQQAIDALAQVDSSITDSFRSGTGNLYIPDGWLGKEQEDNNVSPENL